MSNNKSYADLISTVFRDDRTVYEVRHPKPGLRHNTETKYVHHRFPVKGGKTFSQMVEMTMMQTNPLFAMLKSGGKL